MTNLSKSLGHGGLWLHLIRLLQTRRPGAETVPDLFAPGSIDETFRLLEHRLWLEIAICIDLPCGDSSQRGIDRFGIELSLTNGRLHHGVSDGEVKVIELEVTKDGKAAGKKKKQKASTLNALKRAVFDTLGISIPKEFGGSNWGEQLSPEQLEYSRQNVLISVVRLTGG